MLPRVLRASASRPAGGRRAGVAASRYAQAAACDELSRTNAASGNPTGQAQARKSFVDLAAGTSERRWVSALASPIEDESTQEPGLLLHIVDTTERMLAQLAKARAARDAQLANESLAVAGLREQ